MFTHVAIVVTGLLHLASPGGGGPVAVLALSVDGSTEPALLDAVRKECATKFAGTLTPAEVESRLRGSPATGVTYADAKNALAKAEQLFADFNTDEALSQLESVVKLLEDDAEFTKEKADLLLRAHAQAAVMYIHQGGSKETGRGETPSGKRAQDHLLRALNVEPVHQLNPQEYPPRVRLALDFARKQFAELPLGVVSIRSHDGAQTVVIEGRAVGVTPLRIPRHHGSHRIWLEQGGRRSLQRSIRVDGSELIVEFDFAFESALVPAGQTILGTIDAIDEAFLRRVSTRLGDVSMLLVSEHRRDGQRWAAVDVFDARDKAVVRRGQVPLADPHMARLLTAFADSGDGALEVHSDVADIAVMLDEVVVGVTPVRQKITRLAPGRHIVRFVQGPAEAEAIVDVTDGHVVSLTVRKGASGMTVTSGAPADSSSQSTAPKAEAPPAPVDEQPGRTWMIIAGVGGTGVAAGIVTGVIGAVAAGVGAGGLALSPRSKSGEFEVLAWESANLAQARIALLAGVLGVGALVATVAILVGLAGIALSIVGAALR